MNRLVKRILIYFAVAIATAVSLQFGFFISTNILSGRWNETSRASTSNLDTFHPELKRDQQFGNATQKETTTPPHFTTHSTLQMEHKTSLLTKRSCAQHYDLLILVSSAPANLGRRNNIRKTWAFERAFTPRWTTAFLVAETRDQNLSNSLLKEDETYGDLVRANYYDHYWNQTRKIQMGFEWALRYCKFSFLLKTDDDVFVNSAGILSFLREPTTPREKLYVGNHYKNPFVHRSGKWEVSQEEFRGVHYPDFCPGFGYILSHDVVVSFVDAFSIVRFFRLDDVYVGMLANKIGITIIHNEGFELRGSKPEWQCFPSTTVTTLVRHDMEGHCLFEMFNRVSNITQF